MDLPLSPNVKMPVIATLNANTTKMLTRWMLRRVLRGTVRFPPAHVASRRIAPALGPDATRHTAAPFENQNESPPLSAAIPHEPPILTGFAKKGKNPLTAARPHFRSVLFAEMRHLDNKLALISERT